VAAAATAARANVGGADGVVGQRGSGGCGGSQSTKAGRCVGGGRMTCGTENETTDVGTVEKNR
jgi:hypothetical protein